MLRAVFVTRKSFIRSVLYLIAACLWLALIVSLATRFKAPVTYFPVWP